MLIAGVLTACLLGCTTNAWAATDVVENTNDSGAGSLRETIALAHGGDTIAFKADLGGHVIDLISGAIAIDKSLAIEGPGAQELTIDAGHNSQIFTASSGSLSISGLTLENGDATEDGGAVQFEGEGSLTVSESTFSGNVAGEAGGEVALSGAGRGGAIYVGFHSGPLSISDSTFSGNASGGAGAAGNYSGSGHGGAVDYEGISSINVSEAVFTANTAGGAGGGGSSSGEGHGGAIYVAGFAASASFSDSTFRENVAGGAGGSKIGSGRGEGGAISDVAGDPLTVSGSEFKENVAGGAAGSVAGAGRGAGGAIETLGGGSLAVTDSTFWANEVSAGAGGSGGAISMWNKSLTVSGSTFAGNTVGAEGASGSGGAIDAGEVPSLNASVSISDSTLFGNDVGGLGASGQGGAIDISDMYSATLASVTIDGNGVGPGGSGAGINMEEGGVAPGGAIVTAKATIISGNSGMGATNCDVPVTSSSYSLEGPEGDTSCGFDLPSADPELGALANNGGPTETQALPSGSPAVDAVPVAKCPTKVDQRGEPRPDNKKAFCDVGAYELQDPPEAPAITSTSSAIFQIGKAGSFAVTATGLPAPDLSETGALPTGVVFSDHGDGTASLAGTPGVGTGGSYPITVRASNGTLPDAEQSFTLTVQAPPKVSIATPADGARYTQGQAVDSSFACDEGKGGSGIASCVDQNGHPSGTPLDTAAPGRHALTVTATSSDGLTGKVSVSYTVVAPSQPKTSIRSRSARVRGRWTKVKIACSGGAAGEACGGVLSLTRGNRVIAHAGYTAETGQARFVALRLSRAGLRALRRARRQSLRVTATVGSRGSRAIVLKLKPRRR